MTGRIFKYISCLFLAGIIIASCTNKKNTVVTRAYHNLTAHYNVYFNGKESYNRAVKQVNLSHTDNYADILPVFKYASEDAASIASSSMDRTLKKCSKLIKLHSITAKPKKRKGTMSNRQKKFYKKREYNNWVDDAYLLMGKAHFYKHDFTLAIRAFEYVLREYKEYPIKYEALLWMARSYNETEEYNEARSLLEELKKDRKFPVKYNGELNTIYADHFLKQSMHVEAVPKLVHAIKKTKKKKLRARYKFILAQVYERIEKENKAYEMYGEVIRMNPPYEMAFNAKINRAILIDATHNKGEDIKSQLKKMLRDDKNIDYRDQIYFALGNIAVKEKKQEKAIEYFSSSVRTSTVNSNQKGISSIALADIYFVKSNYELAKNYYDSALVFLSDEYPGYDEIYKETKILNRLVTSMYTIQVEDSLQRLAKMSVTERDKLIAMLIKKAREEEERIKEQQAYERQSNLFGNYMNPNAYNNTSKRTAGGGWYFYNITAKSFGLQEFQRKWGKRKLQDNWRRKNKQSLSEGEEITDSGEEAEDNQVNEEEFVGRILESKYSKTDKNYYLENIPLTDSALMESHDFIKQALVVAGKIYHNYLKDYDKGIQAFEELNSRYPDNRYLLESYYNLYQLYNLKNNFPQSNKYKKLVIDKFPNSTYAKMLTNPNYYRDIEENKKKINRFYEETYQHYFNGNFRKVIENCNFAEKNYKESEIIIKYEYLKTLASGRTSDIRTFKIALKDFIANYPETEEKENATYILSYVDSIGLVTDFYEQIQTDIKQTQEKQDSVLTDTIKQEIYTYDENAQHITVILVNAKNVDGGQLIFNIINHNIDNFPQYDFDTNSELLNDNYHIITIKYFKNKEKAMEYYDSINKNKDALKDVNETDYKLFVISNKNFTTFIKDKLLSEYMNFFKKHYLK